MQYDGAYIRENVWIVERERVCECVCVCVCVVL